jgi:hypothetical protein
LVVLGEGPDPRSVLGERAGLLTVQVSPETVGSNAGRARLGQPASLSGWPDPEQVGVAHARSLTLGGSLTRGTTRAEQEDSPAIVEYRGRLYVSELAASSALEPYLETTGEHVATAGRTNYGGGGEVFRLRGDPSVEVIVLARPGGADGPRAGYLRPRAFPYVARAGEFRPASSIEQPSRLGPDSVPITLEPSLRSEPPDAHRFEYRGGIYRPGPVIEGLRAEAMELIERIVPSSHAATSYGLVEVYRRKGAPADSELLVNLVPRTLLGEYQIWRAWKPA